MQQTAGMTPTEMEAQQWMKWEGMGSEDGAALVPGISNVKAIQLGSAHALALLG